MFKVKTKVVKSCPLEKYSTASRHYIIIVNDQQDIVKTKSLKYYILVGILGQYL